MAGLLRQFLIDLSKRKWEWGVTDCLMVGADWVKLLRGVDPAVQWRGTYNDEKTCAAVVKSNGGILRVARKGLAAIGITETTRNPESGDFAIVMLPNRVKAGAICLQPGEYVLMSNNMGAIYSRDAMLVKAWKIV